MRRRSALFPLILFSTAMGCLLHGKTVGKDHPIKSVKNTEDLQVRLHEPTYVDGVMSTTSGGIITGKNLYMQAKNITYTRKGSEHTIEAYEQLYLVYHSKVYKGEKLFMNLRTGEIKIWNGCTRSGDWYVGGAEIDVPESGPIVVQKAYLSTSENEQNDWSINAQKVVMEPGASLKASDVSFRFSGVPLLWTPSYSKNLKSGEEGSKAPFHYRARWGGGLGFMFEVSYDFASFNNWKNKGIVDYSTKYGLGAGVLTKYQGDDEERFEMLNFLAQRKAHSLSVMDPRYRFQGVYQNYYENSQLNFIAMYDKLSDKGMRDHFSDHPLTNARPGLTQATLWRQDPNWVARMNARVRINDFQTVKQELPLFLFNIRPYALGDSQWMLDNRFSAGYLNYVYAQRTPNVHNFDSTRTELSQKLYRTYTLSAATLTPFIGYRLIHYNSSPQHDQKTQFMGDMGAEAMTRYVKTSSSSFQAVEPYVSFHALVHPSIRPGHTYIFDIEDGWARLNEFRYGFRHNFLETGHDANPRLFQKKLFSDLYTRSFVATPHLPARPTKLWLDSVFDATAQTSYKLGSAYDFQHGVVDHFNIGTRYTITNNLAFVLEYRQRSRFDWRKLDIDNYMIDAARSIHSLEHSQMSDPRKTVVATLFWAPAPNLNFELRSVTGFRHKGPGKYHDLELTVGTIVRGALQLEVSYGIRSGTQQRWSVSLSLGAKKQNRSMEFKKIGQGNYDKW